MNRQTKRIMQRQGQVEPDGSPAVRREQAPPGARPRTQRTTPAQFLREVRVELRKVAWPTREEVVNYSTVVLVTLVILISLIFLLNYAFGHAVQFLFNK